MMSTPHTNRGTLCIASAGLHRSSLHRMEVPAPSLASRTAHSTGVDEGVHTDVDSDGVLDSDQKGHLDAEHPTNPISPKRIKNATKRAKSAMASERAKPKMAYPKSCFESDGLRDTE